jgi:hypothetical protein
MDDGPSLTHFIRPRVTATGVMASPATSPGRAGPPLRGLRARRGRSPHHRSLPARSLAASHTICATSAPASVAVIRSFTTPLSPDPRISSSSQRGSSKARPTVSHQARTPGVTTEGRSLGLVDDRRELDVVGRERQECLQVSGVECPVGGIRQSLQFDAHVRHRSRSISVAAGSANCRRRAAARGARCQRRFAGRVPGSVREPPRERRIR